MLLRLKAGLGKVRKVAITVAAAARPIVTVLRGGRHYQGRHRRGRNGKATRRDTIRPAPFRPANVRPWPPAH